jgi:hypothetical protein
MAATVAVISGPIPGSEHQMEDGLRAREFYHYLTPDDLVDRADQLRPSSAEEPADSVPQLTQTLSPFCQLTALRLNVRKAMLNFMNRDTMFFLGEATKVGADGGGDAYEFVEDPILMKCTSVPLEGKICQLTIRLGTTEESSRTPMFVINDLWDSQFKHMPVIAGHPFYRFYAGVPITSQDGVNIGSLAVMDTQPRPNGLTASEESFLATTAKQVMMFLETNRQAIEGRRTRRMASGLEAFIAGRKSLQERSRRHSSIKAAKQTYGLDLPQDDKFDCAAVDPPRLTSMLEQADQTSTSGQSSDADDVQHLSDSEEDSRTHTKTFARAANLLRECLGDLGDEGSVAFVVIDTAASGEHTTARDDVYMKLANGVAVAGVSTQLKAEPERCTLAAFSSQIEPILEPSKSHRMVESDTLRQFIKRYPGGRVFDLVGNVTSSSSEDDLNARSNLHRMSSRQRPSRRKQKDIDALRKAFPFAAQVLFTPLWNATSASFSHACFISATLETRSFVPAIELPFLNAFCSTLMSECSRLDTVLADKQKADFVGMCFLLPVQSMPAFGWRPPRAYVVDLHSH